MQIAVGYTVQWRGARGIKQMRIDRIETIEGETWLFSALSPEGGFQAVNEKTVKNWQLEPKRRLSPEFSAGYVDMPEDVRKFLAPLNQKG